MRALLQDMREADAYVMPGCERTGM